MVMSAVKEKDREGTQEPRPGCSLVLRCLMGERERARAVREQSFPAERAASTKEAGNHRSTGVAVG